MVEKIIVGRDKPDIEKYGEKGTAFIGKHIVGSGDSAHLTNPVLLDVVKPHVVLICGKRGTGKSYSAAVIAEEMALLPEDIKQNLSVIMIDTMGIFWSMKNPNEKDRSLLKQWKMEPRGLKTKLFVPQKFIKEYKDVGVKVDSPLALSCGELEAADWIVTFGFSPVDSYGLVIDEVVKNLKDEVGNDYTVTDIIKSIKKDKEIEDDVKKVLVNRFEAADGWGVFGKEGTSVSGMFEPGTINVIDVSHFMRMSGSWSIRSLLVGLMSRKIFMERLKARKSEEFEDITGEKKKKVPMVWLMMDEAHQFLNSSYDTAATEPLLTLIKEGRQPGISVLMITQRPGKMHEDALAQSDLVIAHRLTARSDIEALRSIMQTYMLEDITEYISDLPRNKGTAVILDDNSERLFAVQIRPRLSWHAGGSAEAIKEKGLF